MKSIAIDHPQMFTIGIFRFSIGTVGFIVFFIVIVWIRLTLSNLISNSVMTTCTTTLDIGRNFYRKQDKLQYNIRYEKKKKRIYVMNDEFLLVVLSIDRSIRWEMHVYDSFDFSSFHLCQHYTIKFDSDYQTRREKKPSLILTNVNNNDVLFI